MSFLVECHIRIRYIWRK